MKLTFTFSCLLGDIFTPFCYKIYSGNCLQKLDILDLSLIKLLQNQQGCNFLYPTVYILQCKSKNITRATCGFLTLFHII